MRKTPLSINGFKLDYSRLAYHRRALNISQRRLAEVAGVSAWTVLRLESNQRPKGATEFEMIAFSRALGVPVDQLRTVVNTPADGE